MGDDSSRSIVKSLKKEWSLFLEAFQGEENSETEKSNQKSTDAFDFSQVEVMNLDKVREITKGLTEDRKKLNQKLETLSKELDLNSAKLESLRLVGGNEDETYQRIQELNDLGHAMAEAMAKLDKKLREARSKELEIQEEA
ncbi:hypothetical protein [Bdellovibrio svalbardensis]|uniref:Uncharacterized protein n=1 Tax=Bdellovibrio svalbardensis TaxID=2972972 RepID=A0ABT6DEI7_9BACT|nr:hypothetical protein [Bdellovibrio svalbardensis]MDG0815242.1 hypothetical protein [Bdellovibrio svalbardensis]